MKSRFIRWLMRQPEVQEELRKAVAAADAEKDKSLKSLLTRGLDSEFRRRV